MSDNPSIPAQIAFSLPHRVRQGAGDFMPDVSNQAALSDILNWPGWPTPVAILIGPHASGKSHLLKIWAAQSKAHFLDSRTAFDEILPDLQERPVIAMDDADTVTDELLLFRAINHVISQKGSCLLCAKAPPDGWPVNLPDLKSRLKAAHLARIDPPSDALLAALLIKQLTDRQLRIDRAVIEYILKRTGRSAAAMAAIAARLDRLSLEKHQAISLPLAREALAQQNGE